MFSHFGRVRRVFGAVLREWQRPDYSLLAAGIAYYAFFSIIPVLVIAASLGSLFLGQAAVDGQLSYSLSYLFGARTGSVVEGALAGIYSQPSDLAVAAAVGILIVGASYFFVRLRNAVNLLWGVKEKGRGFGSFLEGRLLSLVMVVVASVLLLVWLAVGSIGYAFVLLLSSDAARPFVVELVNFVLLFGVSVLMFAAVYKLLPSVSIEWDDVWLGSVVTSFLFTSGEYLFAFFVSRFGIASFYGAISSVFALLVWLYFSAYVFLFGALFTKVYASLHGSRRKRR